MLSAKYVVIEIKYDRTGLSVDIYEQTVSRVGYIFVELLIDLIVLRFFLYSCFQLVFLAHGAAVPSCPEPYGEQVNTINPHFSYKHTKYPNVVL